MALDLRWAPLAEQELQRALEGAIPFPQAAQTNQSPRLWMESVVRTEAVTHALLANIAVRAMIQ